MTRLDFELETTATGSRARAARFRTQHNEVLTPTFMPVGTHAALPGASTQHRARREAVVRARDSSVFGGYGGLGKCAFAHILVLQARLAWQL